MLFVELRFFVFFAVVLGAHWWLRDNRWRKALLLCASYLFYAVWNWKFVGLIWLSTVLDYSVGNALAAHPTARWRRPLLTASIAVNLAILFVFKYFDFFLSPLSGWTLRIILPVGISFYTFETISYTVDIFRGARPAQSLLDFALFLAFLPHLMCGPILRPSEFLPQLESPRRFGDVDVRASLMLVLCGFVKKACIGDNLVLFVDRFFADPAQFGVGATWTGVLFWVTQAYCDFSGYSDMAIGLAGLLGYRLVPNFDAPYLSASIAETWRRWHMSLGRFLRDYLYIPLGGSRGSQWLTARNLMITMVLCGLWHGAAWRFVAWGGVHGALLIAERAIPIRRPKWLGIPMTFASWCFALVLFRAVTLSDTWVIYRGLVGRGGGVEGGPAAGLAVFAMLALTHVLLRRWPVADWGRGLSPLRFASLYGAAWAAVLPLVQLSYRPFMYFQF
jgi:D-alanyl-lipoteichoic acid acyltransferase DltB (MBOAT superfamily)